MPETYICKKCESHCIVKITNCCVKPETCLYTNGRVDWESFNEKPWLKCEISNVKNAFVVMNNNELDVNRKSDYPTFITTSMTIAKNKARDSYIYESNCPIKETKIFRIKGQWYGPVNVLYPSKEDEIEDAKIEKRNQIIERAKELGMTDEEIDIIGNK